MSAKIVRTVIRVGEWALWASAAALLVGFIWTNIVVETWPFHGIAFSGWQVLRIGAVLGLLGLVAFIMYIWAGILSFPLNPDRIRTMLAVLLVFGAAFITAEAVSLLAPRPARGSDLEAVMAHDRAEAIAWLVFFPIAIAARLIYLPLSRWIVKAAGFAAERTIEQRASSLRSFIVIVGLISVSIISQAAQTIFTLSDGAAVIVTVVLLVVWIVTYKLVDPVMRRKLAHHPPPAAS